MSEMTTFSNMTDSKSIVRFVRDIERHPCLYNLKSFQYTDRDLKRQTWIHIAKRLNATVAECKEKWRKIRTAYSRSLKPKYLNGVRTPSRPYYLASYLKFITPTKKRSSIKRKPFLPPSKNKKIPPNFIKKDIKNENEPKHVSKSTDSEDELDIQEDNPFEPCEQMFSEEDSNSSGNDDDEVIEIISKNDTRIVKQETIEVNKNKTKEVKQARNKNNHNCDTIHKRCSYCANIERKPRKMFLFSILPEIEDFTDQQMRIFRRGLIDLIDKCKFSEA
ncbi:uncharacterized protein LOC120634455 [Pararge aegeria]|uniref:uncharacterized protein LOC120634455 n=1 Tax=Pararge aegeria TaxID=116150 RepID=UPI0019D3166F|nr:uncharacterized protein LOC120634455 [Pararge aegeria]